ncbi:hypothetical protein BCR44DRAFT_1442624 [Catenaria anguillulae PL171]|uniref:Uncharacterized protein n=1 Tax=Catenaria anguillulae PL171 TaxID=765915 RepID=A0A1Y2H9Y1_9FUNG|nr:hypothetical protein BCR44DRAFT_1442624 [Catenaria anguillulae PL171]
MSGGRGWASMFALAVARPVDDDKFSHWATGHQRLLSELFRLNLCDFPASSGCAHGVVRLWPWAAPLFRNPDSSCSLGPIGAKDFVSKYTSPSR